MDINKKKELIKQAAEKEAALQMRRDTIEKVARSFPSGMDALKIVGWIGGAVIVARFANKLSDLVERGMMKSVEPIYFEKMLKSNPALMEEDVKEVAELWSTLYRTSPRLAKDPVAAGGFITQNINARVRPDLGGPTIDTYDTLSKIENNMRSDEGGGLLEAGAIFGAS